MNLMAKGGRVLLLEFNEISWDVIDRLTRERGPRFLPNLNHIRKHGTWGSPTALEHPPNLDPWITWVTLHTGVPQDVHGARILEQDAATVTAHRSWEYAELGGKSIGVFGSIGSFPPRALRGFVVPGPFAPSSDTCPPELRPIQDLNRLQTKAHGTSRTPQSLAEHLRTAFALFRFGLSLRTCGVVAAQLLRERFDPSSRWRRVILQPLINFDFFKRLYLTRRPDFATWHSNHAAHFMHHYWRAWSSDGFRSQSSAEERARYGEAVPLGYKICDELLGRFLRLIDADTTLIVCSSMGQQPYVSDVYEQGKVILKLKSVEDFLARIEARGVTEIVPTMVPQINLRIPDSDVRRRIAGQISGIQRSIDGTREPGFAVETTGEIVTMTPLGLPQMRPGIQYCLPGSQPVPLEDLFLVDAPTVKQGMHHPIGMFAAIGRNSAPGRQLGPCSNLDIAPTVLCLLDVPVPSAMKGRPLLTPA